MTAEEQRAAFAYCSGLMQGTLYRLRAMVADDRTDEIGPVIDQTLKMVEWWLFRESAAGAAPKWHVGGGVEAERDD